MTTFFSWQHAIRSSKMESTTKLVCYTIWSHMASDGTGCFPSYALIAEESGLSRRCVIDHVDKAEKAGFLVIDARQRENGSASSNVYRPTMPGSDPTALGGDPNSLGGSDHAAPPEEPTSSSNPSYPSVSPKPKTKASTRALPAIRLSQFLQDFGGHPPCEWGDYPRDEHGWDSNRVTTVWRSFERYWNSPDCRKPLKRDWFGTWQNWCDREAQNGRRGGGAGGTAGGGLAAAIHGFVARGERNGNPNRDAAFSSGGGAGADAGNDGRRYDGTDIPF